MKILVWCGGNSKPGLEFSKENVVETEDFERMIISSDTKEDIGKSVSFGGQVFNEVDTKDGCNYYQIYTDPINYGGTVMTGVPEELGKLKENQIILIDGVVVGSSTGTNLMGGEFSNLLISVVKVEESTFSEAIAPSLKKISINQTQEQNGVSVTIEKIEFSTAGTRLYVDIKNDSSSKISVYSFDFNLVSGGKNYTEEYIYGTDYLEIDSSLAPNTSTSGIVVFPVMEYQSVKDMIINFEAPYADDYNLDFEDYNFTVEVK